jgi:metacaspase-1
MPKGIALTIGLNSVDPKHYGGWSGDLVACEADAEDMAEIAQSKGFTVTRLLTKQATRSQVINEVNKAATSLQTGDIFMLRIVNLIKPET